MTFWGYGLFACAIAVVLSSVELLTKYESRSLREIFLTRYYWAFAALNSFFCFIVYWSLPYLSKVIISSQISGHLEGPLIRALVAGLGYLAIARSSVLDLKVHGEPLGVGFDAVYNGIAHYLLRHHNLQLSKTMRDDFSPVYRHLTDPPIAILSAAKFLVSQSGPSEDQRGKDRIKLLLIGKPPAAEVSFGLYIVIRDYSADPADAARVIQDRQEELKNDALQASSLRRELDWLFTAS
jgi:hypothetical protein